ncbi:MAG: MaoC/PaaZ C-terminal domain-containing protein [Hydrogenothermaceae bacterium]|nr:MaoC/PaaZ C-terminal domain-containing protein [Hydrogenothermaceae bacterium]
MQIKTHLKINQKLNGTPISITEGQKGELLLRTTEDMVADEKGLIHGGFIFSAADYLAMITVNHPNVVLGSSSVRFIKPVKVGDEIIFKSEVILTEGIKSTVKVEGFKGEEKVFEGEFKCYSLDKHVLER